MMRNYVAAMLGLIGVIAGQATARGFERLSARRPPAPPPPPVSMPPFSFGPVFGSHMVLQMAPAKAAVYGYLGDGATAVKVTVSSAGKELYSVDADITATLHQPFGPQWGVNFNACVRACMHACHAHALTCCLAVRPTLATPLTFGHQMRRSHLATTRTTLLPGQHMRRSSLLGHKMRHALSSGHASYTTCIARHWQPDAPLDLLWPPHAPRPHPSGSSHRAAPRTRL